MVYSQEKTLIRRHQQKKQKKIYMVRSKLIHDHIRPLLVAGTDPDTDSDPDEPEMITESDADTGV